jgi:hypothetical protein
MSKVNAKIKENAEMLTLGDEQIETKNILFRL